MQGFYTTTLLSPNLALLENGSLLARNCPLARSGWMEYLPSELGLESQHKVIKVYRDPKEVFDPKSLRSLEGLTVVDQHPPTFISPDTFAAFVKGHGQNIRRGTNGNSDQVLGDLVISDPVLISKVQNNTQREISLGYNYQLYHLKCGLPTVAHEEGEEICTCDDDDGLYGQRQILGNHIAVVTKGRAGEAIAIQDACPAAICCPACDTGDCLTHKAITSSDTPVVAVTEQPLTTKKERPKPMAQQDWLRKVFGLGLKAVAADGTPDELASAALAYKSATDSDPGAVERNMVTSAAALENAERRSHSGNDKQVSDTKGKDKMPDLSDHPDRCQCDSCKSNDGRQAKMLDRMDKYFSKLEQGGEAPKPPTATEFAAKDEDGAAGEDPDIKNMGAWKKQVDGHMADMADKMATLHDGLSQLLEKNKETNTPGGTSEGEETEAPKGKDSRRGKDARRGRDEDPEEMSKADEGEIPAKDAEEEAEPGEESDTPPTQHESKDPEEAEYEAADPEEEKGEDEVFESAPEESLKAEEIPVNPLPKAKDKARDSVSQALLREHLKRRPVVANPNNYSSTKAWDAERDAWNKQFRLLTGKSAGRTASDRSYGDLNRTKKPDNLRAIDGKTQTQDQINDEYKELHTAFGEWMRNGMKKGEDPRLAKKKSA